MVGLNNTGDYIKNLSLGVIGIPCFMKIPMEGKYQPLLVSDRNENTGELMHVDYPCWFHAKLVLLESCKIFYFVKIT